MTITKAFLGWLILLVLAFVNGAGRAYCESSLGAHHANQVSCGTGILLFAVAVWIMNRRWPFQSAAQAWRVGGLWLALTIAWEFLFFHYLDGYSWEELSGNYAFWKGNLWVLVLVAVLVLPAAVHGAGRRKTALAHTFLWGTISWGACGLVLVACRALFGVETALWVHLAAAPLIAYVATLCIWNHPRHPRPLAATALLTGAVFCLDLLLVAPFFEGSFAMFESVLGTWLPMGFIGMTSLMTGLLLDMPAARRPFLKWMPDREDLRAPMPGDTLLDIEDGSTHAITIRTTPDRIWPWLVQMGLGRAGWYSHDRLDNWGHRSADRILPALQSLEQGDHLPSTPDGKCFFEVLELMPASSLVLGSHLTNDPLHSLTWSDPAPPVSQHATWAFALVPEERGATRLRVRARGVSTPAWRWAPINAFFSVAHIIMQRKQLLTLKQRAEA